MKHQIKHLGTIVDEVFKFESPKEFMKQVRSLEGERVELIFKKFKPYKSRSGEQNRYYHGVIVKILSDELGYTPDDMHEILKLHHLGTKRDIEMNGKNITLCMSGSTSSLTTSEFEKLMSKIRTWASIELGIWIPEPNEVEFKY